MPFAILCTIALLARQAAPAAAQGQPPPVQTFPLNDTQGLVALNVMPDVVDFQGRKAVRLANPSAAAAFATLPGTDFQDGTIEADIAVKIVPRPGISMPGFIGIAFRARPDISSYDMFYIRPGLAREDDQMARNQVAQYSAAPNYGWYELRRAWPWVYESNANVQLETWTHMKIVVAGRVARLFLNDATQPTLVVDGMKGPDLRGGVALFGFRSEEAYFSNVRVTNAQPQPVKNGDEAAGIWDVRLDTDAGTFDGTLQLHRDGNALGGVWSGALGKERPVAGTWREGYVELTFAGEWSERPGATPVAAPVTLAGWIDGASGKGRSKVEGRADGRWKGTRKTQ
jgi:hypothetical protein